MNRVDRLFEIVPFNFRCWFLFNWVSVFVNFFFLCFTFFFISCSPTITFGFVCNVEVDFGNPRLELLGAQIYLRLKGVQIPETFVYKVENLRVQTEFFLMVANQLKYRVSQMF